MKHIIFSLIFLASLKSQAFTLMTGEVPPLTSSNKNEPGLCIELIQEIFKRSQLELEIVFKPWARSQYEVINQNKSKGLIITPLTRTKEREKKYDWHLPLYKHRLIFASTKDHKDEIHDLEKLKKLNICVLKESPADYKVTELKIANISRVPTESNCIKLLRLGRIDAILTHGRIMTEYNYKNIQGNLKHLFFGHSFVYHDVYLASTKGAVSKAEQKKMKRAFQAMKADGTYKKIIKKYDKSFFNLNTSASNLH